MQSLLKLLRCISQVIQRLFFKCRLITAFILFLNFYIKIERFKLTLEWFFIIRSIILFDSKFFIRRKTIILSFLSFSLNIHRTAFLQLIAVVLIFFQVSVMRRRTWLPILFFPCIIYSAALLYFILVNNIMKIFAIWTLNITAFAFISIDQLCFLYGIVLIKSVYFLFWMASIFFLFYILDILSSQAVNVIQNHFLFLFQYYRYLKISINIL
jgi:hypothetical protein